MSALGSVHTERNLCSDCFHRSYCTHECQKASWPEHKGDKEDIGKIVTYYIGMNTFINAVSVGGLGINHISGDLVLTSQLLINCVCYIDRTTHQGRIPNDRLSFCCCL